MAASGISGLGCGVGAKGVQVAPRIVGIGFSPAVGEVVTGGAIRLRGGDAVQRIVGEGLRAGAADVVGNLRDVAVVVTVGVDVGVGEIENVGS